MYWPNVEVVWIDVESKISDETRSFVIEWYFLNMDEVLVTLVVEPGFEANETKI